MSYKKFLAASASVAALTMSAVPAHAGADPFIGEIMLAGFNYCPRGYANASGQLVAISTNQALFALLGTTYGGDGRTTFALPNLNGRVAVGQGQLYGGSSYQLGQVGGVESTTMSVAEMPIHTHVATVQTAGPVVADTGRSTGSSFAVAAGNTYVKGQAPVAGSPMNPGTVTNDAAGGSQAQENRMPYLALQYCIATQGIFPSRN